MIGADLVGQTDSAALLVQIQEDAPALGRNPLHGRVELRTAVAPGGMEDLAGQTAGMHPYEHVVAVSDVAPHERQVRLAVDDALERHQLEITVVGRQLRRRHLPHQPLVAHAVLDQIGDRDHEQLVPACEPSQLRHPSHGAVVVHDLADDADGMETGNPRQIDRGFGLAGSHQHAAVPRPQRKHVAGTGEIPRLRGRIRGGLRGDSPIGRRYPRARRLLRLDRHAERGGELGRVLPHHERNVQTVQPVPGHRKADQTPTVLRHEVDQLGGRLLGRDRQIAFVLAVLVVDDDDHPPLANRVHRLVDRGERSATRRIRQRQPSARGRPAGALLSHDAPRRRRRASRTLQPPGPGRRACR